MNVRDELARQALLLGPEDRVYLADLLEQSLAQGETPRGIAAAWSEEIDRRIEAYDRGSAAADDFETSLAAIRQ